MIKQNFSFDTIIHHLTDNIPFAFTRYGDGEWSAIFGEKGSNCDGHTYHKDMGIRLAKVLYSNPAYYVGMQPHALRGMGDKIQEFKIHNNISIDFVNADIIHKANMDNKLPILFNALNKNRVIVVGPPHLRTLDKYFQLKDFIQIPAHNAWSQYHDIFHVLKYYVISGPYVILFSAGMMSEVLIDDLYNIDKKRSTFIDCGSVFDPYCGVKSRKYHNKIKINE